MSLTISDANDLQMRQTRLDLGFQSVRMHGVFVDDMSAHIFATHSIDSV